MRGLILLLGLNLAGMLIVTLARLPLPGHVVGMILLAAGLFSGIVRLEWVEGAAELLLQHFGLFFIPVIVGTMEYTGIIKAEWLAMVGGLVGATLCVLIVTGWVTQLIGGGKRAG